MPVLSPGDAQLFTKVNVPLRTFSGRGGGAGVFVVFGAEGVLLTYDTLLVLATYKRARRDAPRRDFPAVRINLSSMDISRLCSTAVRKERSIRVCPRMSNAVAEMYIGRNRGIHGNRSLFVVSRIPCRTTLHATATGIRTTRTRIRDTKLRCRDGGVLFSRGIVSRCSLSLSGVTLTVTRTTLRRTGTNRVGTGGSLSCARIGDPISNVVNVLPCHTNALIDPSVPRPLAAMSSGRRVFICFSVARGRLHDLFHRCNSPRRAVERVPRVLLRLGSKAVCSDGNCVRDVDNVVGDRANATSVHTMFPGGGHLLFDKNVNGIILSHIRANIVIVPRNMACRVRSGVFMCGIISNGTISARVGVTGCGSNGHCVIRGKLSINSGVVSRNMKLIRSNVRIRDGRWKKLGVGLGMFVSQPVLSVIVSIIVMLLKKVTIGSLPVRRCPSVTPPAISI